MAESVWLRQGDLAEVMSTKPQKFPQACGSGNQQMEAPVSRGALNDRSYVNPVLNLIG